MVPTLGASAVVMAMQLCDQVSLAGFGYDMQHPDARLHYYESLRMGAMKAQVRDRPNRRSHSRLSFRSHSSCAPANQVVHDISAEKLFLRDLVAAGAVTDLTGAL